MQATDENFQALTAHIIISMSQKEPQEHPAVEVLPSPESKPIRGETDSKRDEPIDSRPNYRGSLHAGFVHPRIALVPGLSVQPKELFEFAASATSYSRIPTAD